MNASIAPVQTISPVQSQKNEPNNQNNDFDILFKIFRNGYDEKFETERVNKPVEVLVRIVDNVDFSEYDKTKEITNIITQYDQQNGDFVNSLKSELLDLQVARYSHTSPYITFILKNRKNLEHNLLKLASSEKTIVVNSNENIDEALEESGG
ncbi:hypothetical protein [Mycoplasmopsis agassizii]|nr:hypothetical protein [Mycoplasmopsis agassizii]